jgi:mRNA-degrading endonuclease toxin of MazEF toxin-antitoxin module
VIAARVTTTSKNSALPTVVRLEAADPLTGYVLADDLVQLYQLTKSVGAVSGPTMAAVSAALRIALP